MTPREAADRLFDRVMRSAASGDSAQAQQFLPMAIQAYERVRPLDADGAFHLSLLQRTAGDLEGARATAREALESYPDHLLVRGAAGAAALEAGDRTAAEEHYAHLLEVWDAQMDLGLPEYEAHASLLPELRADAREVTGS
jgi:tetratricopeptide (TPR) repeat protein